jgi:hypothetical protein
MTTNTLPSSKVINLFLSNDPTEQDLVRDLIEEFTDKQGWAFFVPAKYTFGDLAYYSFGSKENKNYSKTRNFLHGLKEDLEVESRDLVSEGVADIYDEATQTKELCRKVHKNSSYVSGGAYQFTRKAHGLLLLAKNEEFRKFLRNKINPETGEKFYVPFNLNKRHTRIGRYLVETISK